MQKFDFAQKKLRELHLRPKFQSFGDGFAGLPTFAPFDKILVTCGAEILPTELLHQLKVGGKMVIPLGKTDEQILTRFTKKSEKEFENGAARLQFFLLAGSKRFFCRSFQQADA